jgi:hypothetical protein
METRAAFVLLIHIFQVTEIPDRNNFTVKIEREVKRFYFATTEPFDPAPGNNE